MINEIKVLERTFHENIMQIDPQSTKKSVIPDSYYRKITTNNIDKNQEKLKEALTNLKLFIHNMLQYTLKGDEPIFLNLHPAHPYHTPIDSVIKFFNSPTDSHEKYHTSKINGYNYYDYVQDICLCLKFSLGIKEKEFYEALKNTLFKLMPYDGQSLEESSILTPVNLALLNHDLESLKNSIKKIQFFKKSPIEVMTHFKGIEFAIYYLDLKSKYETNCDKYQIQNFKDSLKELTIPITSSFIGKVNAGYMYLFLDNNVPLNKLKTTEIKLDDFSKIMYGYRENNGIIKKLTLLINDKGNTVWDSKEASMLYNNMCKGKDGENVTISIGNGEQRLTIEEVSTELISNIKYWHPNLETSFVDINAHGDKTVARFSYLIKCMFGPNKPMASEKILVNLRVCYSGSHDERFLPDPTNALFVNKNFEFAIVTSATSQTTSSHFDLNNILYLDFFKKHATGFELEDFLKFINTHTVKSVPQISLFKDGIKFKQLSITKYLDEVQNQAEDQAYKNAVLMFNQHENFNTNLSGEVSHCIITDQTKDE